MSGVEAAGFVLAAVPIVLQLLEQYKEGIDRTAVIFRRRKLVEKLGHALLMQRTLLGANLKSLLLDSGVDGASDVLDDPFGVLRAAGVEDTLEEYLGLENYRTYSYALLQCEKYVKEVTGSLEGFGADLGGQSGDLVAVIKANTAAKKGNFDIGKRVNLTLRKDTLERAIRELDKSTGELERLQKLVTSNHTAAAASTSRRSSKSAFILHRVRQLAERLHREFSQQWLSGCHDVHEVKLLLDNRLNLTPNHKERSKRTISFDLWVSSDCDDPCPLWHETVVEAPVDDDDDDAVNTIGIAPLATLAPPGGPRVSILIPQDTAARPIMVVVQSICVSIDHATAPRKRLRLHIGTQCQLSCDHIMFSGSGWRQNTNTVTLENLLLGSFHQRVSLKGRMVLAVNLASSLLQLQNTPWLGTCWTKRSVHFAEVPRPPGTLSQGRGPGPGLTTSADISRPFVLNTFPDPRHALQNRTPSDAKSALLELGILLLELWHETTFEARFPTASMTTEHFARFKLAWEWLDDVDNPPPDLYSAAISQCVKCFFGGKTVSFDWEDVNFRRAICQDIVEPLYKTCKQWM